MRLRRAPEALPCLLQVAGIGVAALPEPYAWRVQHVDAGAGKDVHSDDCLHVPKALQDRAIAFFRQVPDAQR